MSKNKSRLDYDAAIKGLDKYLQAAFRDALKVAKAVAGLADHGMVALDLQERYPGITSAEFNFLAEAGRHPDKADRESLLEIMMNITERQQGHRN